LNDPRDAGQAPAAISRSPTLSPWWRRACVLTVLFGVAVLVLLTSKVYHDAPPIPQLLGTQVTPALRACDGQSVRNPKNGTQT
jgi:nitric oxide reductase large subunit